MGSAEPTPFAPISPGNTRASANKDTPGIRSPIVMVNETELWPEKSKNISLLLHGR